MDVKEKLSELRIIAIDGKKMMIKVMKDVDIEIELEDLPLFLRAGIGISKVFPTS
jgi:hypothetical protein